MKYRENDRRSLGFRDLITGIITLGIAGIPISNANSASDSSGVLSGSSDLPSPTFQPFYVDSDAAPAVYGAKTVLDAIDNQLTYQRLNALFIDTIEGTTQVDQNNSLVFSADGGNVFGLERFLGRDHFAAQRKHLVSYQQSDILLLDRVSKRRKGARSSSVSKRDRNGDNLNLFVDAGYELSNDWQFYSFGGLKKRAADNARSSTSFDTTQRVRRILNDANFLPQFAGNAVDYNVGGRLVGDAGGWGVKAGVAYDSKALEYELVDSFDTALEPIGQAGLNAGELGFKQITVNLDSTRTFKNLLPGKTTIALGSRYHRESYSVEFDELASSFNGAYRGLAGANFSLSGPINAKLVDPYSANFGVGFGADAQVFAGFTSDPASNVERDSLRVYSGLKWTPNRKSSISAKFGYDEFSDFGGSVTGKVVSKYELTRAFTLRGAASTGFKRPSLQQQYFTAVSTNVIDGSSVQVGTFPIASVVSASLGGGSLQPETTTHVSFGTVVKVLPDVSITLDAYEIDVRDKIFLSESFAGDRVETVLAEAGISNVDRARFFLNGLATQTRGVDFTTSYSLALGDLGDVDFSAAIKRSTLEVTERAADSGQPGLNLVPRNRRLTFEEVSPESKIVLGAKWNVDSTRIHLTGTRYGDALVADNVVGGAVDSLESKWVVNAFASTTLADNMHLGVGVDNVFDHFSDDVVSDIDTSGTGSAIEFVGRQVYARLGMFW